MTSLQKTRKSCFGKIKKDNGMLDGIFYRKKIMELMELADG